MVSENELRRDGSGGRLERSMQTAAGKPSQEPEKTSAGAVAEDTGVDPRTRTRGGETGGVS